MNNNKLNIEKLIKEISGGAVDAETSCIRVSGKDAKNFLQGQLTNDIEDISEETYQISSFLTNQGKVIAILRVIKTENGYLILTNKEITKYFIEKISIYILNSDVTINIEDNFLVYGVLNDTSEELIEKLNINKQLGCTKFNEENIWILNNSTKQFHSIIIVSMTKLNEEKINFKKSCQNILMLTDILRKYLRLNDSNKERYIPQVLNLDMLNGINFKKGCYTGQEIVARTHYLGKVKKKIFLISSKENSFEINEKIYNQDNELLGEIIFSSIQINNLYFSLAVIKIDTNSDKLLSKNIPINIIC